MSLSSIISRARAANTPSTMSGLRGRARERGMTLIEILIVMLIIGMIMWSATMSLGAANQAEVIKSTNQLASTIRFAYDRARFTGYYYRIHINFEKRSFQLQKAEEAMYLPATDRNGELELFDADKAEDKAERDRQAAEAYYSSIASAVMADPDDPYDPYAVQQKDVPRQRPPLFEAFEADGTLGDLGEVIEFPEEVEILSVQTDSDPEPLTAGETSIYFFPRGRTQLAAIQLRGKPKLRDRVRGREDIEYTILVQPLTGKVTVEPELIDLELPEVVGDVEDDLGEKAEKRSL